MKELLKLMRSPATKKTGSEPGGDSGGSGSINNVVDLKPYRDAKILQEFKQNNPKIDIDRLPFNDDQKFEHFLKGMEYADKIGKLKEPGAKIGNILKGAGIGAGAKVIYDKYKSKKDKK